MNNPIHFPRRQHWNPTRFVVLSFALIIFLGTVLLHLPLSCAEGTAAPWLTCLFTATSATCVTGLVLVDTALAWSWFGQAVILCMIQLGGLGFITLITLVSLALHRRISLTQRLTMASALNLDGLAGVVRVVRHALTGTFLLEGVGAVVLCTRFIPRFGPGKGLWMAVFHSVSAFCNAGFDLMGEYSGPFSSLAAFSADPVVLLTLMVLIVLGGLGFFVWEDWLRHRNWRGLSLYSKMALAITAALILLGAGFFLWIEWDNPMTLGSMPAGEKLLNALFQSVTLRTAGFSVIDQGLQTDSSAVLSILLMLVGGSSGSTAGGIKTVTVGVLLLALRDGLHGRDRVVFRGRTIPQHKVMSAVTLSMAMVLLFLTGSMILSLMDAVPILSAAFETASALATVGLSMGITPRLNHWSTLLVTAMMYLGRVGILSFSIAFLTRREQDVKLKYPTADMMIG